MSCLDCGEQFTMKTIKPHTSCITESAKYAARSNVNTQSFCADCQLPLAGAVASLQHYESKKHKSTLRRKKMEAKNNASVAKKGVEARKENKPGEEMATIELEPNHESTGNSKSESPKEPFGAVASISKKEKKKALKKAMTRVVKGSSSQKVKMAKLVNEVKTLLGRQAPDDLEDRIKSRCQRSPFSTSKKGSVSLA